jgi:hypothetical protein
MQPNHFSKTLILTLVIVFSFIACLEFYWRSRGFTISYNDDKVLWATQRKKVYKPADQLTVFIGGSRIKFDIDIPTWQKLTGEEAIQLALVGTPARLTLRNLANDKNFVGKLIIDVAEFQFFTIDSVRRDKSAREAIEYYNKETPAQKASALIDYKLESNLVFLEEGKYGLNALLNDLQVPNRAGVVSPSVFPKEFSSTNLDRQNWMTPMFLANPNLQKRQKDAWAKGIAVSIKTPAIKGDTLNLLLAGVKASIDKIRSRGGKVVFVRPPSTELYIQTETRFYPRQQYWDYLLTYTNTPGIYYSDYPATANFVCPEASHLSPTDAATYTKQLVKILKEEKGWTFPKADNSISINFKP